jgi:hypothetical protein
MPPLGAIPGREFAVGAILSNVQGSGRLFVGPGAIELRPSTLSRRMSKVECVRHRGTNVQLYRARLIPPWINSSVVVSDGTRTVLATFPAWMRKRIVKELHDSGFHTTEKVNLIDRGRRLTF